MNGMQANMNNMDAKMEAKMNGMNTNMKLR